MRYLTLAISLGLCSLALAQNMIPAIAENGGENPQATAAEDFLNQNMEMSDSLASDSIAFQPIVIRDLDEIIMSLPDTMPPLPYNPVMGPWIFSGYRNLTQHTFSDVDNMTKTVSPSHPLSPWEDNPICPIWLRDALTQSRISQDFMYNMMVYSPETVDYTYWDLPVPPRLPEDDVTLGTYIRNLNLPEISTSDVLLPEFEQKKKHWLHKFNTGLQFSQAYVSKNWYQGGNNYVALLYNFYWDVQLNQTYHPNEIFQSTVNYKFGLNSIEQNAVGRRYSISEDNFQYNVKYGFKAFKRWFYTITGQFKTQFFNNYKTNTDIRSASFLSPGDLNLGLGMTSV